MAGCGWHEEPDGFRYLEVNFRESDPRQRSAVLQTSIEAVQGSTERIPMLVRWEAAGFDVAWFKQVKDANRVFGHLDLRIAFVGLGSRGRAYAGMLNLRVGHERVRHFDDEAAALGWLREDA